jgi:hypothetical protein
MNESQGLLNALNVQTSSSVGSKKLFSEKPEKTAADITVAGKNPTDAFAASLRQQDLARREVFDPSYRKALNYALDTSQPEKQATDAGAQAEKANQLTRDQFMRLQSANGSLTDPRLTAETDRWSLFDAVRNVAGAENTARQSTMDDQMQQLGNLTSYGAASARQALGLQTGASSAYTARQQQLSQLKQTQQSMAAQAMQANIGMGVSIAMSAATIAAVVA